jgi:anti-anti-sigma factor
MTRLRALARAAQLSPGDHASWVYDAPGQLREAAAEYFAVGAARGERLVYVGGGDIDRLVDDLSRLAGRDRLMDDGQLSVHEVGSFYGGRALDPRSQVSAMLQLARAAEDEGWAGLRILGDTSDYAADPDRAESLLAYEAAVGNVQTTARTTALCAFDRNRTEDTWRALSALHALQHAPGWNPPFTLQLVDDVVVLAGEIDIGCVHELRRLLRLLGPTTSGELVLDLREVGFIDVAGTRVLATFANLMAATGRPLRFRNLSDAARRTFPVFSLGEEQCR